ncbi:MAG: UTP--glucose-1-phosphate uridylyltransferase, partial [Clostridia bacterium]|nr:UTP--glucose-1-phosphate uridylyltransferase [Clostridia bacterium]
IKKFVKNEPFALMFGDDVYIAEKNQKPALKELIEAYEKTNKYVLGCVNVSDDVVDRYGVAVVDGECKGYSLVKGFKEKPKKGTQPSNLAALGRYIILPNIFENIFKVEPHENGEVFVPEAIALECDKNNLIACEISAKYNDLGNKLEFVKCTVNEALKDPDINKQLTEYLKGLVL